MEKTTHLYTVHPRVRLSVVEHGSCLVFFVTNLDTNRVIDMVPFYDPHAWSIGFANRSDRLSIMTWDSKWAKHVFWLWGPQKNADALANLIFTHLERVK